MSIASTLLPEFDHEMGTTRRLLERVPEAAFEWKPHEKSMSLGQLADHLSNLTGWANLIATSTTFDIARGIQEVLTDSGLRQRLIQAGTEQTRRFNWLDTARNVLEVYNSFARRR
mgnify:CR=1 FL=1